MLSLKSSIPSSTTTIFTQETPSKQNGGQAIKRVEVSDEPLPACSRSRPCVRPRAPACARLPARACMLALTHPCIFMCRSTCLYTFL